MLNILIISTLFISGSLAAELLDTCTFDHECPQNAFCRNSICACLNDFYVMPLDKIKKECIPRVPIEGPCGTNYQCGINAICEDSKCYCQNGYFAFIGPTRDTHCYKEHGCKSATDCSVFPNTFCDNGFCRCNPGSTQTIIDGTCVQEYAPIGIACRDRFDKDDGVLKECGNGALCTRHSILQGKVFDAAFRISCNVSPKSILRDD